MTDYIVFTGGNYDNGIKGIEQYLPERLAASGNKVVSIEYPRFRNLLFALTDGYRRIEGSRNLIKIRSVGLPFGRKIPSINRFNHMLNWTVISKLVKIDKPSVISFTPEYSYIQHLINPRKLIYYVTDNYFSLPFWRNFHSELKRLEQRVLAISDRIITVSPVLVRYFSQNHPRVTLFRNPVDLSELIISSKNIKSKKRLASGIKKVGFIGGLYEWKIDKKLILQLLSNYPGISFVFAGIWQLNENRLTHQILSKPNFKYTGFIDNKYLGRFIYECDACIIPYKSDSWGKSAFPAKIYQFLYFGKPVVTTELPSLAYLGKRNLIYYASDYDLFIRFLGLALNEKKGDKYNSRRYEAVRNSWPVRLKKLMTIIN
ncbi:MAG: hypothetical protein UV73_C0002G0144 [Candidatus Gottesmanbacteria bacterium GW2011_GWA2_43_14]|uniref:Group 1 glycosyl transferase n=1 Tax=Candidatus Gottesmanbacteria bacterium GW2011_GWA2_43_14 TaxID=1618443 RepID=A0A0G1DKN6_9BACT|nr:MAG: hypothetical protein UV73_C0002G0144 [Candidatus Gottesmanbacteria bacterium GW2011_GWA2_43_14]